MNRPRILVVGAGASGLAAAIVAAESGASVSVLEAGPRPGRSIMASGNGRCNFCNADLSPERYNDPEFVHAGLGADALGDVLGLFDRLGLWYFADDEGRYFPRSRFASSVLDVLLNRFEEVGEHLWVDSRVVGVEHEGDVWTVRLEDGDGYEVDRVIWCAGGRSFSPLSRDLGLRYEVPRPVLCPLATDPRPAKDLDGVRVDCTVRLERGGETAFEESGEVLVRKYGISGIVVFNASRLAQPGDRIVLDLAENFSLEEVQRQLEERSRMAEASSDVCFARLHVLDGTVHPKLGIHLAERVCGKDAARPVDPARLAALLKRWEFKVAGTADEEHAQVTRGGIANDQVDPSSFECRGYPGLFICGEALDVDGACGGLNLAWAWKSGSVAGRAAALS